MDPVPDFNDPARQRAFAELVSIHYPALREMAMRTLRIENETLGFGAEALSPTELVADAVACLMKQRQLPQTDSHLRGLASVFMTRVIADVRRKRLAAKRDARRTSRLDTEIGDGLQVDGAPPDDEADADLASLETAMLELAEEYPRQIEVVSLHCIAGIPVEKVAAHLDVSLATAHRDLESGRRLLAKRLKSRR